MHKYKMRGAKNRKRVGRRRLGKKLVVPRTPKLGGFTVTRRVPTIYMSNGNTNGAVIASNPSGTQCLSIGTPEAHPVFGGIYSVPFTFQFTLDQLVQYGDMTGIGDKYQIKKVKIKAMYNANAIAGSTVAAAYPSFLPNVNFIQDHDDSSVQTVTQLQAKMGLKTKSFADGRFVSMSVAPRCAQLAFNGVSSSGYTVPTKAQWLNSTYYSVPHYGIKGYIENMSLQANSLATSCVTFELEYTIGVKDLQ